MVEFSNFTCWSVADAQQTISTEAVSPSKGIFLATHAPLAIRRRPLVEAANSSAGKYVNESDVLEDFVNRPTNKGVLLLPVIGQSGTGKSHLVRWIHENLADDPKMKVIYLPKTATSLADVVDRLLLESEGEEFDELRNSSKGLDRNFSQGQLERRLLDTLAEALIAAVPKTPQERALVGNDRGLALLMHDPFFREHLLREGALIPRRAKHLLDGKGQNEKEVPLEFRLEDLPANLAEYKSAALASQKMYLLLGSNDGLKEHAVRLLNENLDIAVMEAANLGIGRLQKAMLRIRELLLESGEQIVLLIEDFALIQGVQRDLLDAITETGVKDGVEVYAPIRTVMAVTSGYFDRLEDTVRSRVATSVPHAYDLDVQFGNGVTNSTVTDFLGRYLNAARAGQEAIESGVRKGGVPNACESCDFIETCHAAFGTSSGGYGLYPFNASALVRSVRSKTSTNRGTAFNPRMALGGVLRHVLVEYHDEIQAGEFPSARFREDFPTSKHVSSLPTRVQTLIEENDPVDADRRKLVLEFWGDSPEELINLDPALHTVFGLSEIQAPSHREASDPGGTVRPTESRDPSEHKPLPNSLQKDLRLVEDWASRAGVLPQGVEADLRRIVRDAVIEHTRWTAPLSKEPASSLLKSVWSPNNARTVSIEGSRGAGLLAEGHHALIEFRRTGANAQFFMDLLRADAGFDVENVQSLARLDHLGERYSRDLQQLVVREREASDPQIELALTISYRGAMLGGRLSLKHSNDELLNTLCDDGRGWSRDDIALRTPEWTARLARHLSERGSFIAELRDRIGISQGKAGSVQAIDAARVMPLVRKIAKDSIEEVAQDELPRWVRKAAATMRGLGPLVSDQIELLNSRVTSVRELLPQGDVLSEVAPALRLAFDLATPEGLLPGLLEPMERDISALGGLDAGSISRLERELSLANDDQRLNFAVASVDRGHDLGELETLLSRSAGWLRGGLDRSRLRLGNSGNSATSELEQLLDDWRNLLEGGSHAE